MYEIRQQEKEKAILVTVALREDKLKGWDAEDSAKELKELALSSSLSIVDEIVCKRDELMPNYLIGKGKAEEIHQVIHENDRKPNVVVFSENLSSTQLRNLEQILGVKTIDRTQLILDVFAKRAHTNEGKLQVELAQLEYLLPRLSGLGVKLSRLGGGIGTRGPGEKMLETDRRGIRRRIKYVKADLESLSQRRGKLRINRHEHSIATIALVGYTNAGKSTFLNSLTGSDVLSDNKLFSTLDPTSRKYILPNNQKVLFVDTVGFIHNLPHNLIEAFKATLEEVKEADLLLHILDISSQKAKEQFDSVYEVLKELGVERKPVVTALNKIDKIDNKHIIERFRNKIDDSIAISALNSIGFEALIQLLGSRLPVLTETIELFIPHTKMAMLSSIYKEGKVLERKDTSKGIFIKASVPSGMKQKLPIT
jgi:GTP-binding protein HflX